MILSITFDDAFDSWNNASEILSKYKMHGTFNTVLRNMVHKRVDNRPKMFPPQNVLTWKELHKIEDSGHEIASHGVRHVDLPQCSDRELWLEIVGSKRVFDEQGFKVDNYACAFNACDKRVREYALKHYKIFRGGSQLENNFPLGNVYHAVAGAKAVDYVSANPRNKDEWVVGIWHDINPVKFEETVKHINHLGVKVLSVCEVYKKYGEPKP